MARKSRAERFAPLEDENIREQIPKKVLPLIEQLVLEQCIPVNAALTFRLKLLEIQVKQLEQRLNKLDPQPAAPAPSDAWPAEIDEMGETPEFTEDSFQDSWEDPDEEDEDQDEVPF
jgi:hypothetical protein